MARGDSVLYFRRTRFDSGPRGLLGSSPSFRRLKSCPASRHSAHSMLWKAKLDASSAVLPIDKVALTLPHETTDSAASARRTVRALLPVTATR